VSATLKCTHQIVGEIIIEHQIAHRCSSMAGTVSGWLFDGIKPPLFILTPGSLRQPRLRQHKILIIIAES
ncbi:MAG: hypothetical protein ACLPKT_16830, partial [Methylocella sp.]